MNIQQAAATGKSFKRPDDTRYLYVDSNGIVCIVGTNYHHEFTVDDLMSDLWEVYPPPSITITKTQLIEKIEAARVSIYTYKSHHYLPGETDFIAALVEELFPTK